MQHSEETKNSWTKRMPLWRLYVGKLYQYIGETEYFVFYNMCNGLKPGDGFLLRKDVVFTILSVVEENPRVRINPSFEILVASTGQRGFIEFNNHQWFPDFATTRLRRLVHNNEDR
jgi:hypothetical protein